MIIRKTGKFAVFDYANDKNNNDDNNDDNNDNNRDDNEKFFNELIYSEDITYDNARDVSRDERDQMKEGISRYGFLTYGEISYQSMKQIFDEIKTDLDLNSIQPNNFMLYDLGSGSGASTLAAMLQLPFKHAIGIEILVGLYEMSLKIKKAYEHFCVGKYNSKLTFLNGSILDPWSWVEKDQPCIVFANSTCFNDEMFSKINENSILLKPGSYVVTLSIPIVTPKSRNKIKIVKELRLPMSWGESDVFIHVIT